MSPFRPITVNVHTLQVKRTSLWNKACEELKKHQELLTKCQADDNFLKDPFGDPFADTEIAKEFAKTAGHDRDDDNEDGHSDDNSDAETRAKQQALLAKAAAQIPSPSKKSKKGRPKTKKVPLYHVLYHSILLIVHYHRRSRRTLFPVQAKTVDSPMQLFKPRPRC